MAIDFQCSVFRSSVKFKAIEWRHSLLPESRNTSLKLIFILALLSCLFFHLSGSSLWHWTKRPLQRIADNLNELNNNAEVYLDAMVNDLIIHFSPKGKRAVVTTNNWRIFPVRYIILLLFSLIFFVFHQRHVSLNLCVWVLRYNSKR